MNRQKFIPRFFNDMEKLQSIARDAKMGFDDLEYLLWDRTEHGLREEEFFCDFTSHQEVSISLYNFCLSSDLMESIDGKKGTYKLTEYGKEFINTIASSAEYTQKKYEKQYKKRQRERKSLNRLVFASSVLCTVSAIVCCTLAISFGDIAYLAGTCGNLCGAIWGFLLYDLRSKYYMY